MEILFGDFQWKYCGNGSTVFIPDHFISSGSSMTIKFHSDRLGTKPGFFATWEEVQGMYSIKSILTCYHYQCNLDETPQTTPSPTNPVTGTTTTSSPGSASSPCNCGIANKATTESGNQLDEKQMIVNETVCATFLLGLANHEHHKTIALVHNFS